MPEKHHPTPEERDERISVPLDATAFVEGVLEAGPHDDEGTYDVVNAATMEHRIGRSLAHAHSLVNEIVHESHHNWAIIRMPEPGGGTAGTTVSEGHGPIQS